METVSGSQYERMVRHAQATANAGLRHGYDQVLIEVDPPLPVPGLALIRFERHGDQVLIRRAGEAKRETYERDEHAAADFPRRSGGRTYGAIRADLHPEE